MIASDTYLILSVAPTSAYQTSLLATCLFLLAKIKLAWGGLLLKVVVGNMNNYLISLTKVKR